jgi:Flp pilus assembly CpaF family ATPase
MPDNRTTLQPVAHRGTATTTAHKILVEMIGDLLDQEGVTDVKCQPQRGGRSQLLVARGGRFDIAGTLDPDQVEQFLNLIAALNGKEFNRVTPRLNARIPGTGERLYAARPPVTAGFFFAIRRPYQGAVTLDLLIDRGAATAEQIALLRRVIAGQRHTMIISGVTGSGKTTMLRACLSEPAFMTGSPAILQDPEEFRAPCPKADHFAADPMAVPPVTLEDLVADALRVYPTHIVIGEVRRAEAYQMIAAWFTGHRGLATIHANSAWDALDRIAQMISFGRPVDLTVKSWIAKAVNVIVHLDLDDHGQRTVGEILKVEGYHPDKGFLLLPLDLM